MQRVVENLSPEAFAPFGSVITLPRREPTASGAGFRWWGELVTLRGGDRPYAIGFLDLDPGINRFDWAERHMLSDELIVPLTGECLVYVAPPDYLDEPERLPPLDRFRVFRVAPGQAVLLNTGVWHGAPLADSARAQAMVILLSGTAVQDTALVRFEATPIDVVG